MVADIIEYRIYLPMVSKSEVVPTPSPTQTPLPTQPPIVISGNIQITTIFFNGVVSSYEPDEYVEIKNFDTRSIQVEGLDPPRYCRTTFTPSPTSSWHQTRLAGSTPTRTTPNFAASITKAVRQFGIIQEIQRTYGIPQEI